ncbi:MAG: hypothetical protein IPK82_28895 [Polyangiaceae bacterium]|nr:hypothetical protein [Polyangiaceae bacterium]
MDEPPHPLVWWQPHTRRWGGRVTGLLVVAVATAASAAMIILSLRRFGPESPAFSFVIVWLPMTWLGTFSHFVGMQLPKSYHTLRPFEMDGQIYQYLGVRLVKRLLRRGPFALFNPGLHLPVERTPEQLNMLEQRMRTAETTHALLLVLTLGVVANAAARGWWVAAASTLVFNLVINGYPVMLQRYNRALLHKRFA